MNTRRLSTVAAIVLATLMLPGCLRPATSSRQPAAEAVADGGITQAEAEGLWNRLAAAADEGVFAKNPDEFAAVVVGNTNLRMLLTSGVASDYRSIVESYLPDAFAYSSGEGEHPGYMEARTEFRQDMLNSLKGSSSEDLAADMVAHWMSVEGSDPALRTDVPWQAFSVVRDALLVPAQAEATTISVQGTDTVSVTYPTRLTIGGRVEQADPSEWTAAYRVAKSGDDWVIIEVLNLTDYVEACARAAAERARAAAADPRQGFIHSYDEEPVIAMTGSDGRWWAVRESSISMGGGVDRAKTFQLLSHKAKRGGDWRLHTSAMEDHFVEAVADESGIPRDVVEAVRGELR